MKIGLFGFTMSHENMGCQALTYSFLTILDEIISAEDKIIIFSYSDVMGRLVVDFSGLNIEYCKISLNKTRKDFFDKLNSCDIIFDETFGDGFSDIYFVKSAYKDAVIKLLIGLRNKRLIMTPQTYGPFKHKSLEIISGLAIKKASIVMARDSISAEYAKKISHRDVVNLVDLAFLLPYKRDENSSSNKTKIGLNISGLLWKGGFSKENQFGLKADYRVYCQELIKMFSEMNYEVHLIPHVTKSGDVNRVVPDGDVEACEELHNQYREQTVLAPVFDSPIDVKSYISGMDYFIGARMHSTIAAFSTGVVTIPFAYSRKFQGLFCDLEYPIFIDGKVLDTREAVEKTVEWINNSEELKTLQCHSLDILKNKTENLKMELRKILSDD